MHNLDVLFLMSFHEICLFAHPTKGQQPNAEAAQAFIVILCL